MSGFWRSTRAVLALLLLFAAMLSGAGTAAASSTATPSPDVDSLVITQVVGITTLTVEIEFDTPITEAEAEQVRSDLTVPTAPEVHALSVERLGCQQSLDRNDANGFITLQYQCFPTYAVLNWGFRLSPALQATVAGGVSERGMNWWRNSVRQAQNAPHTVPANYLLHGTLKPMFNGDIIDYQDYMTWRHAIYTGGTASVTIAGSVAVG